MKNKWLIIQARLAKNQCIQIQFVQSWHLAERMIVDNLWVIINVLGHQNICFECERSHIDTGWQSLAEKAFCGCSSEMWKFFLNRGKNTLSQISQLFLADILGESLPISTLNTLLFTILSVIFQKGKEFIYFVWVILIQYSVCFFFDGDRNLRFRFLLWVNKLIFRLQGLKLEDVNSIFEFGIFYFWMWVVLFLIMGYVIFEC